jgi:hypothetical protein
MGTSAPHNSKIQMNNSLNNDEFPMPNFYLDGNVSGFPVELASDDEDNVDALVAGLDAESNLAESPLLDFFTQQLAISESKAASESKPTSTAILASKARCASVSDQEVLAQSMCNVQQSKYCDQYKMGHDCVQRLDSWQG